MEFIGSRLDRCVQNRRTGSSVFRAKAARLYLELRDCVDGRQYNEIGTVEEIDRIGIVVNSVQQVIILCGSITVCGERASCGVTTRIRLWRVHASSKLC